MSPWIHKKKWRDKKKNQLKQQPTKQQKLTQINHSYALWASDCARSLSLTEPLILSVARDCAISLSHTHQHIAQTARRQLDEFTYATSSSFPCILEGNAVGSRLWFGRRIGCGSVWVGVGPGLLVRRISVGWHILFRILLPFTNRTDLRISFSLLKSHF